MQSLAPKPVAAFVLSVIGGGFIFAGGLLVLYLFILVPSTLGSGTIFGVSAGFAPLLGLVSGPAIMILATLFYREPEHGAVYGTMTIALSVVSYVSALGGLFVGLIMGLIGGVLILVWRPSPPQMGYHPTLAPYPAYRTCPRCGRAVVADARFCSYCGNVFA